MKSAATWWRVSSSSQMEMSPDTQIQDVSRLLEAEGYRAKPEHILGADWSSPEIMDCPEMQQLIGLVESGTVEAIGVYHPDRLAARPLDRLVLSPNPPKDTDGRREDSGRGWVRELQGRWPGVLG